MTLTVHKDLLQGTDEWFDVRRGIVTASTVGNLITMKRLTAGDYACPDCGAPAADPCRSKTKQGAVIKTFHPDRTRRQGSRSRRWCSRPPVPTCPEV